MIQGRGPRFDRIRPGMAPPRAGYATAPGGSPRGWLTKFQVCSPKSTSARAMRARPGTIHTNSIRASPSCTMRDEMTSPNRSPPGRRTAGRSREADGGVRRLLPPGRRTAEATAGVRHEKWRPGRIVPSRTPPRRHRNRGITRKPPGVSGAPTRPILPERHNRDDPVLRTRPSPADRPPAPRRDPGRTPAPLRTACSAACACSPGPRSPRRPPGSPRPAETCAAAGRAARSGAD